MQGTDSMNKKPYDFTAEILEDRRRRARARAMEAKALGKHRKRIKARLVEGREWPIDARTGERAELDHGDVMAPLPDDLKMPVGDVDEKMLALRAEADKHRSFSDDIVPIDEGVLQRRRRERDEAVTAAQRIRGEKWTEELVDARIEEAFRTLFKSSISGVGPREFGSPMPEVLRQVSDLVHQAGNKSLRNMIAHRFRGIPGTEEVRRANESLGWALQYLRDEHPDLALFLNLGGMWKAWDAKISKKCRSMGISRQAFYRDRKEAVRLIVEGLTRDGKAPT